MSTEEIINSNNTNILENHTILEKTEVSLKEEKEKEIQKTIDSLNKLKDSPSKKTISNKESSKKENKQKQKQEDSDILKDKFQYIDTDYENFMYDDDEGQYGHDSHVKKVKKLNWDVEQYVGLLDNDIETLHKKISLIQAKQHEDYLSTFNQFMETVKKDINEKI